jgi:hypothetical protein
VGASGFCDNIMLGGFERETCTLYLTIGIRSRSQLYVRGTMRLHRIGIREENKVIQKYSTL